MSTTAHDLIVCSLEAWDDVWRRNQFLVQGLLDRDPTLRVLFVEPSSDPVHELTRGRRPRPSRGFAKVRDDGRLQLFQPTKWLPRMVGPTSDWLLRHSLSRAVRQAEMTDPVLWVNDPSWAAMTRTGWPALYDITDDWVKAHRGRREHDRIIENEDLLLRTCREVVVCSPGLAESKGQVRPVTLIRNAVDTQRFRRPTERPTDLPPGRIVLYVGTLHEDRLDVDLCSSLAQQLAAGGSTLALVGPVALNGTNQERLRSHPNVWMAGPRPNASVPAYLQHADVLIVPHVVDDFTDSLDPIKLYEYLAVGRPVVSTPVAGFRELASRLSIADRTQFVSEVLAALVRGAWATDPVDAVPDWSVRVSEMTEVLDRLWPD